MPQIPTANRLRCRAARRAQLSRVRTTPLEEARRADLDFSTPPRVRRAAWRARAHVARPPRGLQCDVRRARVNWSALCAEEPIAGVAKARHDVGMLVQMRIERGYEKLHIRM